MSTAIRLPQPSRSEAPSSHQCLHSTTSNLHGSTLSDLLLMGRLVRGQIDKVAFVIFSFIARSPQASEMARWLTWPGTYADAAFVSISKCCEVTHFWFSTISTSTESHWGPHTARRAVRPLVRGYCHRILSHRSGWMVRAPRGSTTTTHHPLCTYRSAVYPSFPILRTPPIF